jgi:hypothetical protein
MAFIIKGIPPKHLRALRLMAKKKRTTVSALIKQAAREHCGREAALLARGQGRKPVSPGRIFMNCDHTETEIGFCCDACFMAAVVSAMLLVPPEARPKSGLLLKEFFKGRKPRWAKEFLEIGARR